MMQSVIQYSLQFRFYESNSKTGTIIMLFINIKYTKGESITCAIIVVYILNGTNHILLSPTY